MIVDSAVPVALYWRLGWSAWAVVEVTVTVASRSESTTVLCVDDSRRQLYEPAMCQQ